MSLIPLIRSCAPPLLLICASAWISAGNLACASSFPLGQLLLEEVDLDTSVFDRSAFSRNSLTGTWVLTNDTGQTRRAVFDAQGDLVSFELPSDEIFEPSADDTVEILLTTFGAFGFNVQSVDPDSGAVRIIHEFQGLFSDDGTRIQGDATTVADNLSAARPCDCRETWELLGE